jgi:hypothetical protein
MPADAALQAPLGCGDPGAGAEHRLYLLERLQASSAAAIAPNRHVYLVPRKVHYRLGSPRTIPRNVAGTGEVVCRALRLIRFRSIMAS